MRSQTNTTKHYQRNSLAVARELDEEETSTAAAATAAAADSTTTTGAPEKPAAYEQQEEDVSLQQRAINAHASISRIWPTDNDKIAPLEDVECCVLANSYTESWAPTAAAAPSSSSNNGVRLLVLAESHATTHRRLTGARLADPALAQRVGHRGHLNVVHCLSYGESWMLEQEEKEEETAAEAPLGRNSSSSSSSSEKSNEKDKMDATVLNGCKRGTPQFWRVLAALAGIVDTRQREQQGSSGRRRTVRGPAPPNLCGPGRGELGAPRIARVGQAGRAAGFDAARHSPGGRFAGAHLRGWWRRGPAQPPNGPALHDQGKQTERPRQTGRPEDGF